MPARFRGDFARVKAARELLREKAEELFTAYMDVIQKATDSGQYETAAKHLQWLIDHMPAAEDGQRMIDHSVDKNPQANLPQQVDTTPRIQIGIKVGGIGDDLKKLPEPKVEVIDASKS
jgi:hypothetical protein